MTDEKIPVAVIGAGNMGSNHIRVYDELPGVELVEVVETRPERATEVEEEYGVNILSSVDEIDRAEAATVAVPNRFHKEISLSCIERGIDILVEKPLAESVDEAHEIAEKAENSNVILQVGHIERFNPAVDVLKYILKEQEVIAFEAHRLGPFNEQLSEASVVFDLMIHDIDLVNTMVNSDLSQVNAVGSETKSNELDHVFSQFEFENDVVASLTASHVTHGKIRTLDVTTEDAYIRLDYQKQNITVQRRGTEKTTSLVDKSGYRTEAVTESPYIKREEPLKRELRHFMKAVRGEELPQIDVNDGVEAVELAMSVVNEVK